jgi:hypothetical protein
MEHIDLGFYKLTGSKIDPGWDHSVVMSINKIIDAYLKLEEALLFALKRIEDLEKRGQDS